MHLPILSDLTQRQRLTIIAQSVHRVIAGAKIAVSGYLTPIPLLCYSKSPQS